MVLLFHFFSPHLQVAFLFYSINTEHYFLVAATSKASDYSIYDISPLPYIADMFSTRTHIFTFIFLFSVYFFSILVKFIEWLFFFFLYILPFNRLLTSSLRPYIIWTAVINRSSILHNNACPCAVRTYINTIESGFRIPENISENSRNTNWIFKEKIYCTTVAIISRRKLTPQWK